MRRSAVSAVQLSAIMALMLLSAQSSIGAQNLITVEPPSSSPEAGRVEERPVSYSEVQAERGSRVYQRYCLACHGRNLNDGEFGGPPLRGSRFEENFGESPVSALYSFIEATMPPDRPSGLSRRERTEVVAYILSRNGYREGDPLPVDIAKLDQLILVK